MGNQEPHNFPFFFSKFLVANVFSKKPIGLKVLGSSPLVTSDQESAKEMVRDWQRKLRSEVRGVDRSIRRDPANFSNKWVVWGGPGGCV